MRLLKEFKKQIKVKKPLRAISQRPTDELDIAKLPPLIRDRYCKENGKNQIKEMVKTFINYPKMKQKMVKNRPSLSQLTVEFGKNLEHRGE